MRYQSVETILPVCVVCVVVLCVLCMLRVSANGERVRNPTRLSALSSRTKPKGEPPHPVNRHTSHHLSSKSVYLQEGVPEDRGRDQMRKRLGHGHEAPLHGHQQPRISEEFLFTHARGNKEKFEAERAQVQERERENGRVRQNKSAMGIERARAHSGDQGGADGTAATTAKY